VRPQADWLGGDGLGRLIGRHYHQVPQPDGRGDAGGHLGAPAQGVGVAKPNRDALVRRPKGDGDILPRLPRLLLHPIADGRPFGVDDGPERPTVVNALQYGGGLTVVAHQSQCRTGVKRGGRQRFRDQRAQPNQPVGAGGADHPAAAENDGAIARHHAALLAERVAIVPGQAAVGAVWDKHSVHVSQSPLPPA